MALLCALCLGAATARAEDGLRLRPTAGTTFPDRAYVLTLPAEAVLDPRAVHVRENGALMHGVSVVPADAAATGQFGVILVIDASKSMHGEAITGALEAARAFSAHRQPNQLMAVLVFNRTTKTVVPFTTSSAAIDAGLKQEPPLAAGTHIYDAVTLAVSMLHEAEVTVGSVVVLSDGADTGSLHSLGNAAAAADDAGVRVFSVGLRSGAFDSEALQQLARDGGGSYAEARTPADLEPILDQLGAKLASEYLIRYRSTAAAGRKIAVAVTVDGYHGAVTAGYASPALASGGNGTFQRSIADRLVRSSLGMLVVALMAAGLFAGGLAALVRPRVRGVRRRLGEFVSLPIDEKRSIQARRELLFERAERSFQGTRWWARFNDELDVARITIPPIQIVFWTVLGTAFAVYLLAVIGGTLVGLFGFGVPFLVRGVIRRKLDRQRRLFAEQLPDNLQVLASALRAGHSLVGALSVVVEDSPEPSRHEFRRIVADEQLGVPLEDAFELVARRMDSKDVRQVGLVAALQHETGGNTAEVLDRVADTVRQRFELQRLVRTLTTQGRMSRWVLTGLPVFLLLAISALNPEYIEPLYTNSSGRVVLIVAAVMVTSGSLVIRKIIDIKV